MTSSNPSPDGVLNIRQALGATREHSLEMIVAACGLARCDWTESAPYTDDDALRAQYDRLARHLIETHGRRRYWIRCLNIDTPPVLVIAR